MISAPDYRKATNMAYRVLCRLGISELPITIFPVINRFPHLRLISYSQCCERHGMSWVELMGLNISDRGYICRKGKRAVIFYNDRINPEIIRFTLAHELGHYVLGHTEDNSVTDREANCFARNFLCPVPATDCWKLKDVSECCDIFDITPPAAQVVLDKKCLDHINTDIGLYQRTAQLLGLPALTKEVQLENHSSRTMRALLDFTLDWNDEIGTYQEFPARLHI